MNGIISENAIASFRSREGRPFVNEEGDFDAAEYIRAVMEDLTRDGHLILDFYYDDFDEDGEEAGGHIEYGAFRTADGADPGSLAPGILDAYAEAMRLIAVDEDTFLAAIDRSLLSGVYVARIRVLLRLGAPKFFINNEKRLLANHLIEECGQNELISKWMAPEDGEEAAPGC